MKLLWLSSFLCMSCFWNVCYPLENGMLFPRESPSREIKDLSGLWTFRADFSKDRNLGFQKSWFQSPLTKVKLTNCRSVHAC